MATAGRSIATITAIAALGAVDGLQGYAVSLFTPEIAAALTVGVTSVVAARLLGLALAAVLPLAAPSVAAMRRVQLRLWTCRIAGLASAVTLALTGTVRSTGALVALLCIVAVASAPGRAMHRRLVLDEIAAEGPVRALSALSAAALILQLALAVMVATGLVGSWSTAVVTAGGIAIGIAVIAAISVRSQAAQARTAADRDADVDVDPRLPWKEVARAWRTTPTLWGVAVAGVAVGMLLIPFDAVLSIDLHSRWQLRLQGTGSVFAVIAVVSLVAVLFNAARSDRLLADSPLRLAAESWLALLAGSLLLVAGACMSNRTLFVVLIAMGSASVAMTVPVMSMLAFSVVPRAHRAAMSSAIPAVLAAGAALGVMYATAFENRHGPRVALIAMAAAGGVAAMFWRAKTASVAADQQRVRIAALDDESRAARLAGGSRSPLLECRGIDFSYKALQVLFDVDFSIDDGEVVALLGTNGAGKSTLLKVISGIGLPQRGSVRFAGRDITYLDAEDRVRAGITQVPGGRAVFGDMTVIENLRSFGYQLGRDRRRLDEAIDRCMVAFPQLAARRTSAAATLSGGEQQMVGLCKALILRPRLLLIDELSLGLAPAVVGPLLDLVRRINADGTAVVIVEQSVNIALSLVDHAYFMEKGTVRFDGRAKDLLDRGDLLRAVFLQGAAKGTLV